MARCDCADGPIHLQGERLDDRRSRLAEPLPKQNPWAMPADDERGVIEFGSIKLRVSQRERGTVRLACGACGHLARSLLVADAGSAFGTHSGQDARWPHRLEALCHDSPAKHMHPFSGREINRAPMSHLKMD